MSRKNPTKEEARAFILLKQLHLVEDIQFSDIVWDKPDIQIGNDIGIEVVQLASTDNKQKDSYAEKELFGKGYTGAEAREVVQKKCREKDKSSFIEFNGSHHIPYCAPVVSIVGGGGFNLPPMLDMLRNTLVGKNKKWNAYKAFTDKRCFVDCSDCFFGVENLDALQRVFSEVYSPESFNVLYLFGIFMHLAEAKPDNRAIIEFSVNSNSKSTEISKRVIKVEKHILIEVEHTTHMQLQILS